MNRVKIICSCSKILFLHERLSQNDPEIRFLNSGALICDSEENKNKTFRVKSQKSEKTSRNIKFTVRLFCLLMVNKQTNMEVQHQNLSGPVWSPAAVLSGSTRCRCCCTSPGCPDARVWRGRAHVRERERERPDRRVHTASVLDRDHRLDRDSGVWTTCSHFWMKPRVNLPDTAPHTPAS